MTGFIERVKRSFTSVCNRILLPFREDISFSFGHLKKHLADRAGFMIFYLALGGLLTLITQTESLSVFGYKVLDEQIGISTITLMLAGSAILACITYLFYRTEEPQNGAFLWCHDVLRRVVDTGADLCLIFICITAIPYLFASDHPSLLFILLGYVSLLLIFGVMTYIPTFALNTRKSMRSVTFGILSTSVIVVVLVFLYAAASYK
ncbi:putative transmembrane protein [Pseudomonas veronii 1YdBTEX2]|uniref:Putative transmembrane protein n=1 Tax=Pseudomonas veronii 1YdBTEX2 TaxID=1295141 RepID=A0A1D3K7Y7_PSEVE|nr:putative transmembrane protein [Pseudomonas veronii 1YdBTEX2]